MGKVELWGLGVETAYNRDDITARLIGADTYEETAITEDGRLIGYDEAVNAWVQLGVA